MDYRERYRFPPIKGGQADTVAITEDNHVAVGKLRHLVCNVNHRLLLTL